MGRPRPDWSRQGRPREAGGLVPRCRTGRPQGPDAGVADLGDPVGGSAVLADGDRRLRLRLRRLGDPGIRRLADGPRRALDRARLRHDRRRHPGLPDRKAERRPRRPAADTGRSQLAVPGQVAGQPGQVRAARRDRRAAVGGLPGLRVAADRNPAGGIAAAQRHGHDGPRHLVRDGRRAHRPGRGADGDAVLSGGDAPVPVRSPDDRSPARRRSRERCRTLVADGCGVRPAVPGAGFAGVRVRARRLTNPENDDEMG